MTLENNGPNETCTERKIRKNQKKSKKTKKKNKKLKNINLLYVNANGITGKVPSLMSAAKAANSHIIALTETKIGNVPPNTQGYHWINGPRSTNGGGVALLIREDIKHMTNRAPEVEDQDQEVKWVEYNSGKNKVYIGVYYGPQEKVSDEETERQFSQLTSQINKLRKLGEVILVGDFNAKLEINNDVVQQKISRNGKCMQRMLDETGLQTKSLEATIGHWTRVKRKDTSECSVIDYVLMTEKTAQSTKYLEIDESGAYRLKGKAESDHNTILVELDLNVSKKVEKETIYNTKNKRKWRAFNEELSDRYEENEPQNYNEFETMIKLAMEKTLDKITIIKGQYKPKITEKAKKLKEEKRKARKEFEKATPDQKKEKLDMYIVKQKELRTELDHMEKLMVEARINTLVREGGIKSNLFWKIRKQLLNRARKDDEYDTIDENGKKLTNPEEALEHIASFYENLYQAREGSPGYETWTAEITRKVQEIEQGMEDLPDEPEFTNLEVINVIKNLKAGKAPGPDGIPNEAMKYANNQTLHIYCNEMNKILKGMDIPEQWNEGSLKRLFKGKGVKGKCSNERGITLASNVGKMFERLVNNRIGPEVNMSDAQAGGVKGRATVDHILILKELVNIAKKDRKGTIITYLDVTKAYDKAWLDAILYVLHKQGINTKLWKLVKDLNTNLKTTIQTKHGPTRQISIKDSIRQGGVLSVTLYALMMDEINKDLLNTDLGIKIPGSDLKIPCLLWMDDVVLAETAEGKSQELLNSTDYTSKKYHVEFGMPKTKYLRTGKPRNEITLKIGENTIEETEKYTYLGEINNKRMNLKDQIKNIEGKTEAAYQTLLAIAEDQNFKYIKMECIWKLVRTCIIPIITYGCETWEPLKSEMSKLNSILDKVIKRILMTPGATPREALYIETGLLDVETIMDIKRLNMMARLNRQKSEIMTKVLENPDCTWMKRTRQVMAKYGIEEDELNESKEAARNAIHVGVFVKFHGKMTKAREERSKLKFFLDGKGIWSPEQPAEYMTKLTRKQTSTIFKARTRMTKVKGNYKNAHLQDLICRACQKEPETQQHVLYECQKLHPETPNNNTETPRDRHDNETGSGNSENHENPIVRPETETITENIVGDSNQTENPEPLTNPETPIGTPESPPGQHETETMDRTNIFNEDPDILKDLAIMIDDTIEELMQNAN